jgi:hypothetical protein
MIVSNTVNFSFGIVHIKILTMYKKDFKYVREYSVALQLKKYTTDRESLHVIQEQNKYSRFIEIVISIVQNVFS